jgi:phosphoribosyl 1,2-cyclic phosphodiesterase
MKVTFWGVRGSIPAPGPGTVRYGGNTSCVSVRTEAGALLILDCGTGARNLGLALVAEDETRSDGFGHGKGQAAILLSHTHWDHIQGFPFFSPLYVAGNTFKVYGPARSSALLEGILEGQMAPQYFPVQTLKNMRAHIEIQAIAPGAPFDVLGCRVSAVVNQHGQRGVMAFRIEEAGRSLVYASDAGYGPDGPSPEALALYHRADLLIHDSTYTPEHAARYPQRGLASVSEAVAAAVRAEVRTLALFHYDQDYSDADVDALVERGRREVAATAMGSAATSVELLAAAEGVTLQV